MPITDLVRRFNDTQIAGQSLLAMHGEEVIAWHDGQILRSVFQPIHNLASGQVVAHQADARCDCPDRDAPALFDDIRNGLALVQLDRLVRTLHTLNFLRQQQFTGGYLHLTVHPRHLASVPCRHGLVFEAILKRCGLSPEDIVLEINPDPALPLWHLKEAITNYRQRGYRIALPWGVAEDCPVDLHLITADQTTADILAIATSAQQGWVVRGVDSFATYQWLRKKRNILAQGNYLGRHNPDCHITHKPATVAYNVFTHPGAHHENRQ